MTALLVALVLAASDPAAKAELREEARAVIAKNRLAFDVAIERATAAARELARLERLESAARRLDEAEAAIAAATSAKERRRAWETWLAARHELRSAARRTP